MVSTGIKLYQDMAKDNDKFGAEYHRKWNAAHREIVNARHREYHRRRMEREQGKADEKAEKAKAIIEWHRKWLEEYKSRKP